MYLFVGPAFACLFVCLFLSPDRACLFVYPFSQVTKDRAHPRRQQVVPCTPTAQLFCVHAPVCTGHASAVVVLGLTAGDVATVSLVFHTLSVLERFRSCTLTLCVDRCHSLCACFFLRSVGDPGFAVLAPHCKPRVCSVGVEVPDLQVPHALSAALLQARHLRPSKVLSYTSPVMHCVAQVSARISH